jgi:hypothetical protein
LLPLFVRPLSPHIKIPASVLADIDQSSRRLSVLIVKVSIEAVNFPNINAGSKYTALPSIDKGQPIFCPHLSRNLPFANCGIFIQVNNSQKVNGRHKENYGSFIQYILPL